MNIFSKDKTIWSGEKGGFKCKITKFTTEVSTLKGDVKFSFGAGRYIHGFFTHCATNGVEDQIWYIVDRIFTISELFPQDIKFIDDVNKEIAKYMKRVDAKCELEAKNIDLSKVSEEEKRDLAHVAKTMERANMTRQERRRAEREFLKDAKRVLQEEREEKAEKETNKTK